MATKEKKSSLTDWAKEPTLVDLQADLTIADSAHKLQVIKIKEWLADINPTQPANKANTPGSPFASQYTGKKKQTRSQVQSKLIRKQLEWRYTSLSEPFLNTPDIFNADPVTAEDVKSARQNGLILNNQLNTKMNKVAFIDRMVRTCANQGTVIIRTAWKYVSRKETKMYPVYEIVPAQSEAEVQELALFQSYPESALPPQILSAFNKTKETGIPHVPIETGEEEVTSEIAIYNQPEWSVCDYRNIRFDPTCGDNVDNAQYAIHSYETTKADLQQRGIYKNLDSINLQGGTDSTVDHSSLHSGTTEFTDKARKKIVVFEYWGFADINDDGELHPIVAEWVGDVLIRMELNPFPDGKLPFVVIPFMPVEGSIYGDPDGELLKENQAISGALMRGMIDVFGKSANSQTGVRKGSLDLLNKRKFEAGLDYEFNDAGDAQNSIYMHSFPELPQSAYNFLNLQNQEAESLTGVLAFNQGISGSGLGDTAAAANGALSAAARRELGILRRLAEGVKQLGHKTIAMNQEFLSEEEVVRVTNEKFETIRRDDLGGKIDLRLSVSTAEADEQKAKELSFMLQTVGPNEDPAMRRMILSEIADLRKMPHLAMQIRNYQPQPDPYAEQMKQLEMTQKQAEIQLNQAKIQETLANIPLNDAKSSKLQTEADLNTLEFTERESGVKHARELDKAEAQSEAQAKTKIVDAALKSNATSKAQ